MFGIVNVKLSNITLSGCPQTGEGNLVTDILTAKQIEKDYCLIVNPVYV